MNVHICLRRRKNTHTNFCRHVSLKFVVFLGWCAGAGGGSVNFQCVLPCRSECLCVHHIVVIVPEVALLELLFCFVFVFFVCVCHLFVESESLSFAQPHDIVPYLFRIRFSRREKATTKIAMIWQTVRQPLAFCCHYAGAILRLPDRA